MTEQSKSSGDKSPWWVDQASEIIAPSGPLPAKTQPAKTQPAKTQPAKPARKAPAATEPPEQKQAPEKIPAVDSAAEPQAEKQPEVDPAAPVFDEPEAGTEEPEASAEDSADDAASSEADPQWEQALHELEQSCGHVRKQVKALNDLHSDADTLSTLEGPIGKLEEAVRDLSELASSEDEDSGGDERDRTPHLHGFTSSLPISSILELLSTNRKSGTLCVSSEGEHFTLEILEGDVVHASSDRSTREQLLGSILVARDKIGVEQLEDFYKRYTQSSEAGNSEHETLVSREDLMSALEEQVQELFNRLYSAGKGVFDFYEGGTSNVEQRIRMNVTTLLLESARAVDELDRKPDADDADDTEPS